MRRKPQGPFRRTALLFVRGNKKTTGFFQDDGFVICEGDEKKTTGSFQEDGFVICEGE